MCNRWKSVGGLDHLDADRRRKVRSILENRVFPASGRTLDSLKDWKIEVAEASQLRGTDGAIEARIVDLVVDKGRTHQREIAHVSFPGAMLEDSASEFVDDGKPAEPTAIATRPMIAAPSASPQRPTPSEPITFIVLKLSLLFWMSETWELEVHRDYMKLHDALRNPVATIPRTGGKSRFVFPDFWSNVIRLGVLGDDGVVRWFRRDKEPILRIRGYLTD